MKAFLFIFQLIAIHLLKQSIGTIQNEEHGSLAVILNRNDRSFNNNNNNNWMNLHDCQTVDECKELFIRYLLYPDIFRQESIHQEDKSVDEETQFMHELL
jgi:hypothetical protein